MILDPNVASPLRRLLLFIFGGRRDFRNCGHGVGVGLGGDGAVVVDHGHGDGGWMVLIGRAKMISTLEQV
jgi:hypothetical protein